MCLVAVPPARFVATGLRGWICHRASAVATSAAASWKVPERSVTSTPRNTGSQPSEPRARRTREPAVGAGVSVSTSFRGRRRGSVAAVGVLAHRRRGRSPASASHVLTLLSTPAMGAHPDRDLRATQSRPGTRDCLPSACPQPWCRVMSRLSLHSQALTVCVTRLTGTARPLPGGSGGQPVSSP